MTTEHDDDAADLLAMVTHWYGCLLTARPGLLDHNTPDADRHRLMKKLAADAKTLTRLVYGDEPTVPVPPAPAPNPPVATPARCHSGKDGDCVWAGCPQLKDNEPAATGRHCPLDDGEDSYE